MSGLTLTQKTLRKHMIGPGSVEPGRSVRVGVDWVLASELALNGMASTFDRLGNPPLHDPDSFYLAIDHTVDPVAVASNETTKRLVKLSRDFAKAHKVSAFYDANETIMHTRFYRDHCLPGQIVIGADSHTTSHGALGALAIGMGGADVAVAAVTGETWVEVPEAILVEYGGTLPFGLSGKDVILRTLGLLGRNTAALERCVEYREPGGGTFTTDMRFTICNMTAELGGISGIFEPGAETLRFLESRNRRPSNLRLMRGDPDAVYADRFDIDLDRLVPQIAKPFSPDNVCGIDEVIGTALDGCFIGACTTTEEELVLAALVLDAMWSQGIRPTPNPRRMVVPGDLDIKRRLAEFGLLDIYERAGFRVMVPGCHLCLGVGSERAGPGETWLSSQNRNYHNRMGKGSLAWLASAASVAASSAAMAITDPRPLLAAVDRDRYARILGVPASAPVVVIGELVYDEVAPSASHDTLDAPAAATDEVIVGAVQVFGDHVDTDAIIPGEFCSLTDWTELGSHCCEHVRPDFAERCAAGESIIVAGEAWGTGSAREHAAWALIGAGVKLIIAETFAATHRRNLVNEGIATLVIADPAFRALVGTGGTLRADIATGIVTHVESGRDFRGTGPKGVAADILAAGGIVPMVLSSREQVRA